MARFLNRRHGVNTARRQAWVYHNRERRSSLLDPSSDLFGTHDFSSSDNPIATGTSFPGSRLTPITFSVNVTRTASGSNGIIFEFGESARGMALAIDGGDLIAVAGGNGDNAIVITASAAVPALNKAYNIVFSVLPGNGVGVLWVNGKQVGSVQAVNNSFGGGWSSAADGAIGEVEGTVTTEIPASQRVTLVNARVNGELLVFNNQRPRQFPEGVAAVVTPAVGNPIGLLLALTYAS